MFCLARLVNFLATQLSVDKAFSVVTLWYRALTEHCMTHVIGCSPFRIQELFGVVSIQSPLLTAEMGTSPFREFTGPKQPYALSEVFAAVLT